MRPMDGSRSFEAHAQEPCSGQGLLRSTVTNVRTSTATLREGAKHHENRSRQHPSSARSQSTSGGSSSGRCCGSAEVTVCHCSVGRQEPTRQTFEGSTESRAGQIQGAASGGQGGVMQVVHRTCPASRHTCRRGDQEGSGTKAQQRLLSLQEEAAHPPAVVVPEVEVLQKQIEELVKERRPLASGVQHTSAQRWPRRMVRRQHPRFDRGASHACQIDKIWRVG